MSIIRLSDILAAEDAKKAEDESVKAEKSKADFEKQLPPPVLEDVSPCCGASVDYSLGTGNPSCDKCGKSIYS